MGPRGPTRAAYGNRKVYFPRVHVTNHRFSIAFKTLDKVLLSMVNYRCIEPLLRDPLEHCFLNQIFDTIYIVILINPEYNAIFHDNVGPIPKKK